jgi:hypothetical protein
MDKSERTDWFEITTYPSDPYRVEMRRLTVAEAEAVYQAQLQHWWDTEGQYLYGDIRLPRVLDNLTVEPEPTPDPKADAHQRSREDVAKKRREMRRKGKR